MKRLLTLSLAVLLVASTFVAADVAVENFIQDPAILKVAPHLIQEIQATGIDKAPAPEVVKDATISGIPELDNLISIIAVNFFQPGAHDWSNLEQARLDAVAKNGDESVKKWADLTDVDAHRATAIVDTIYGAVLNIPQVTEKEHEASKQAANTSGIWDFFGASLVKAADFFKKAKGIVAPSPVCETSNHDYIKGAEQVIYYSSLTHGLAGGLLVSAPKDSTVNSLDFKDIVEAVGKLAIEAQMAQNIARLAGLDPKDDLVRLITYLGLAAVSTDSELALSARDVYALIKQDLGSRIPASVVTSLANQAALVLVTKGAGEQGNSLSAENAPILRNIVAFSSDVLSANSIGDTLKYVFCPEMQENEKTSTLSDQEEAPAAPADPASQDAPPAAKDAPPAAKDAPPAAKDAPPAAKDAPPAAKDAQPAVPDNASDPSKAGDQKVLNVPQDKTSPDNSAAAAGEAKKDAGQAASADQAKNADQATGEDVNTKKDTENKGAEKPIQPAPEVVADAAKKANVVEEEGRDEL
ncbi:hypothetical protein DFQ27_009337 [Actinomortierella ambigua]|uniref:Uncharacterized protein n=1 Tax=Actinomortierella ambigua TaxID=1343610 RepID=A0A9P6TX89_9FUNG|nr:hypothetical protein DFQ27_009337 [Actinomortierella ambigua]